MATEIERKFLVTGDAWRGIAGPGVLYRQGYLSVDVERVVRVRVAGERAFLTIKGPSVGARRDEFDYPIPVDQALQLLEELCLRPLIEKTRYRLSQGGLTWEIDEFGGENRGLVVAEVELAADSQVIAPPDWIGDEVTGDPRYYNANLVRHPFSRW